MHSVLVIQGAGMDQRGKTQVEIFGPETLEQINAEITAQASALGLAVEILQSNEEQSVVNRLNTVKRGEFAALIINPGGFTTMTGSLPDSIAQLEIAAYEVHASNPSARGVVSTILPVCKGAICGFGYAGYAMALQAIHDQLA